MRNINCRGFATRGLAILLCFLLSPFSGFCQNSAGGAAQRAGAISALDPAATRNGATAKAREEVFWNDTLQTNASGRMRVSLGDGSVLSLGSNTQMKVVQHDAAAQQTTLEMLFGKLRNQVVKLTQPNSKYEVRTPTAVAGVIGTDFVLIVTADKTTVIVFSGIVQVTPIAGAATSGATSTQAVRVNPGQQVDVTLAGVGPVTAVPAAIIQQLTVDTAVSRAGITAGTVAVQASTHALRNILLGVAAVAAGTATGVAVANQTHSNPKPPSGPTIPPR